MKKSTSTKIIILCMFLSVLATFGEGYVVAVIWNLFFATSGLILTTGQGVALSFIFMILAFKGDNSKGDPEVDPDMTAVVIQLVRMFLAVFALLMAHVYHFLLA